MSADCASSSRRDFVSTAAAGTLAATAAAAGLLTNTAHAEGSDASEVQLLKDRNEIVECQYRYAWGLDSKDEAVLATAFADTIDTYYPDAGVELNGISGPDFGASMISQFAKINMTTQHYMNVYSVEIDGDTAFARTYLRATHVIEGLEPYIVGGYYENNYVRTDEGWRIKRVSLYYTYTEGEDITPKG